MFASAASKLAAAGLLLASTGAVNGQAIMQNPPKFQYGTPNPNAPGVRPTNKNGPTNPAQPALNNGPVNMTSDSRLLSINSIDDWCTFGPEPIGNKEPVGNLETTVVAYCTKHRNNARVIPDGTLTAVHFVKTPLYVQVMALGDFTKINIAPNDEGGELDPHGATNEGNPRGGNVTSNVADGKTDVFYQEWMNYIAYNQICLRVCIAGTDIAPTPIECQHQLDTVGCNFVMPGDYSDQKFDTCDGDSAYPPGIYVLDNGSTSSFQQYFASSFTANGQVINYTNGSPDQTTPASAFSLPATSNCVTTSTIANGIASLVSSSSTPAASGMATSTRSGSGSGASASSGSGNNASGSSSSAAAHSASSQGGALAAAFVAAAGMLLGAAFM